MKTMVALPGEGIGIEVVDAACELMTAAGMPVNILTPPQRDAASPAAGGALPEATRCAAREADAVLFGAAGPSTSSVVAWLRWEMEAWARRAARRSSTGACVPRSRIPRASISW